MAAPTAGDVRRLAEAIDGLRDTDIQVVTDATGNLTYRTTPEPGDTPLFTARTNNLLARAPAAGRLSSDGSTIALEGCDSVFWTEAAVEKFVWPYYAAHGMDMSPIREAYESDPAILAVAHVHPTFLSLVVAGGAGLQLLTWEQYSAGG